MSSTIPEPTASFFSLRPKREKDAVNSGSAGEGNDVMKSATPQPIDAARDVGGGV